VCSSPRARREIVTRLNRAVNDAVRRPIHPNAWPRSHGTGGTTPEQYEKLLRTEYERFEA